MHVTAIVPLFNGGRFIAEALASIRSQTAPVAEIIVVDDGSGDDGPAIAAGVPGVTLLRKPHTGIGETVNAGVAAARGELIAFLDADDRWLPEKTALQLAALNRDPGLAVVFGHARRFLDTATGEQVIDEVPAVSRCAGMFRRSAIRVAGPFGTGLQHEFMTWMLAANDAGLRHAVLPEVVFERRIHGCNDGIIRRQDQRRAYFTTLKAALDRRRGRSL
jgi:glycosyltransferase involved in cell wall biosynthesis